MRRNDPVTCDRFRTHVFSNDSLLCHRFAVTFRESETIHIFEVLAYILTKLLWKSVYPAVCFIWWFDPVTFSHQFIKLKMRRPVPASHFFPSEACSASHSSSKRFLWVLCLTSASGRNRMVHVNTTIGRIAEWWPLGHERLWLSLITLSAVNFNHYFKNVFVFSLSFHSKNFLYGPSAINGQKLSRNEKEWIFPFVDKDSTRSSDAHTYFTHGLSLTLFIIGGK